MDTMDTEETVKEQIRQNAELVINTFGNKLGVELGYDEKSVAWIEGYIERNRKSLSQEQVEGLVGVFGSYLGECVRRNYGGRWEHRDGGWAVSFDEEKKSVYPFNKVEKQFKNGLEDSIVSFLSFIPTFLKLGGTEVVH